jgi:hypothetical protein
MPLTINQKLKALGISTYRPFNVTYTVSPKEFGEMFTKYCKEYLKFKTEVKFELKFIRKDQPTEEYNGELYLIDPDSVPDDDYHRFVGMGIDENTDPGHNFITVMDILFHQPEYHTITGQLDEEISNCIFVTCSYKDFLKYGIESDLKGSETEADQYEIQGIFYNFIGTASYYYGLRWT